MKKLHLACLTVGVLGIAAMAHAESQYDYTPGAGIAVSPHNLNITTYANDNQGMSRICIYCHTPHFAKKADLTGKLTYSPLWNRDTPVTNYKMYDNGDNPQEMGTYQDENGVDVYGLVNHNSYAATMGIWDGMDVTTTPPTETPGTANQPTGVSLMCLSCHDGTIAVNAYGTTGSSVSAGTMTMDSTTKYYIGGLDGDGNGDLSNHHPIGFNYNEAARRDDEIFDASQVMGGGYTIGDLLASSGNMECNTCHDVHNTKNTGKKLVWVDNTGSAFCLRCHDK